jgi:VanZ family protein
VRRWTGFLPALVLVAIIFWFSSMPGDEVGRTAKPLLQHAPKTVTVMTQTEPVPIRWLKVGHVVGYALLGLALVVPLAQMGTMRLAALAAVLLVLIHAVLDEFHQTFVPGRSAAWEDVLLDTAAAGAAIVVWLIVMRYRERKRG